MGQTDERAARPHERDRQLRRPELNTPALRADARRESLRLLALLAPSLFDEAGGFSAANYARFFEQASYIKTFVTTFKVAFIVTGACVLLGYPLP